MYVWDEAKRRSNQVKHDVDIKAIEAFDWDNAVMNTSHHGGEPRLVATGYIGTRLHVVVYTQRGDSKHIIQSAQGEQQGESPICPSLDLETAR